MTDPNTAQHLEMLDILKRTHSWIDSLMVAGIEERCIVPAVLTALSEHHLRASGNVSVTVEWLQRHADMMLALGPDLLGEIKAQGR